jgi:hypothetical protein
MSGVVINGQPPIRLVLTQTPGVGPVGPEGDPGPAGDFGDVAGTPVVGYAPIVTDDSPLTVEWTALPGGGDMLGANNLADVDDAAEARTNIGAEVAGSAASAQAAAIATAASDATTKANAAQAAAIAASQPVDADLTTIAAANNGAVLAATTASFTTADETKLDGIEAGATADQSAAEILAALLTVDGPGSGLDADTLDGNSSAAFATAAQGAKADTAVQPAAIADFVASSTVDTIVTLTQAAYDALTPASTTLYVITG